MTESPSPEPYSRLYHKLADEYPDVYDSPDLADYCRLLVAADQSWPTAARWAGLTSEECFGRLVACGLVIADGRRYRIRGLDKHRITRSKAAARAAHYRWNADRNADGNADRNAEVMPSLAETRRDETSPAEQDAQALWYDLKGGQVSERALAFVRDLQDQFGDERLMAAMRTEYEAAGHVDREFLSRVKGRLLIDGERTQKAAEKRRQDKELEYQRRMKEEAEAMPEEQRTANLSRLKEMLKASGLVA